MSGRAISIAGAAHLKQPATTTCRCWIITAVDKAPFGLTSFDRNITTTFPVVGAVQCKAHRGYSPYAVDASADLSVDNSEMQVLIAEFDMDGITLDAIHRGVYDGAAYIEYLVNYVTGDIICILSSGYLGKVRQIDGIECFPELRSLTQVLKQQAIIEKGSNGCRARLGDERCGVDLDPLWSDRTIVSVGAEADRVFTVDGPTLADNSLRPGLWNLYDGPNEGRSYEIESNTGNTITLAIPTDVPQSPGETGRARNDCNLQWDGGVNSCAPEGHNNRPNFRGEPFRPVADTTSLMAPGAGSSGVGPDIAQSAE